MWLQEEDMEVVILVDTKVKEEKGPSQSSRSSDEDDSPIQSSLSYGLMYHARPRKLEPQKDRFDDNRTV